MKTVIVWFRNDLRIHDHPAIASASANADQIIPLFILDDQLLKGSVASSNRNRFLLESLDDLKQSLQAIGADLVIRTGKPEVEIKKIAKDCSAEAVYATADYTPFAIKRDKTVKFILDEMNLEFKLLPGRLAVSNLNHLATKAGTNHKVFTPFFKQWSDIPRRQLAVVPNKINLPKNISIGNLPRLEAMTNKADLSPDALRGGETEARKILENFLKTKISNYHQKNNDMAADDTSRLSSYLHFGCLSPREIETRLPDNDGARAWHRQLCWREFYFYILFHNPEAGQEFQERYRKLKWGSDEKLLQAWEQGKTGYPAVDAGMRQLLKEGWMHNRARLIVGSFLTKDLWLDWRMGEAHFMRWLTDGDKANNNGNWQWIASVGVDPAPVYRRLYNPSTQRDNYDPSGKYVKRYLPELKNVPDKYLSQPWTMPKDIQIQSGCIIGKDYPEPIVDHKLAREAALANYHSIN